MHAGCTYGYVVSFFFLLCVTASRGSLTTYLCFRPALSRSFRRLFQISATNEGEFWLVRTRHELTGSAADLTRSITIDHNREHQQQTRDRERAPGAPSNHTALRMEPSLRGDKAVTKIQTAHGG